MYRNTDFIYDAVVQLENRIALPVTVGSARKEYDAILTIKDMQFTVTAKAEIRTANKGLVLAQLKELESKTRRPIIIIAKFIASDIALEFKEKSINYLDLAGNTFIQEGDFFIYITGQKAHKASKTNQTRAFQEAGIRLIFNLLTNPEHLQHSYRELAEETGIAIGSISHVMKELEDLKFILKTDTKRVLKNKSGLLDRWIVAYQDVLRPRLVKRLLRFADKSSYSNWKAINLNPLKVKDTRWGGEPAAAILTNYLKPAFYTIYTTKSWQECAKSFGLIPDENGDVEIVQMFWTSIQPKEHDLVIVPPVLVYADLINSGNDRNLETAQIIFDNELQHLK